MSVESLPLHALQQDPEYSSAQNECVALARCRSATRLVWQKYSLTRPSPPASPWRRTPSRGCDGTRRRLAAKLMLCAVAAPVINQRTNKFTTLLTSYDSKRTTRNLEGDLPPPFVLRVSPSSGDEGRLHYPTLAHENGLLGRHGRLPVKNSC